MRSYVDVLERFDRKERGWLVRECTGGRGALAARFCESLGSCFGTPAPTPDAWWTIDYHLDWLAAASRWEGFRSNRTYEGEGVTGTIEDIDLIVATPAQLMLIEAKAAGSWSNSQLRSKLKRLEKICPGGKLHFQSTGETIDVQFGILSIRRATRVDTMEWPAWALRNGTPNIVFPENATPWDKLAVQRVSEINAREIEWRIVSTGN